MPYVDRVKIYRDGNVVSDSQNLRGLRDYASKHSIKSVKIRRIDHGEGHLSVLFSDGAHCTTFFASFTVLCGWLRDRRSWHGAPISVQGESVGEISSERPSGLL